MKNVLLQTLFFLSYAPQTFVFEMQTIFFHTYRVCKQFISSVITYGAKLLNADWLRQRAFFLNHEGTFW